jgi:hypothetical protein
MTMTDPREKEIDELLEEDFEQEDIVMSILQDYETDCLELDEVQDVVGGW